MTHYDESTPQVWKVPLRDTIVPGTVVTAPKAGYLVPSEYAKIVASWLDTHGVAYRKLAHPVDVDAQVYRADEAKFAARSEEHTSELQSLMRISYAVFCLKKKKKQPMHNQKTI